MKRPIEYPSYKKEVEKAIAKKDKSLARRYASLYKDINRQLAKRFAKYERDGTLNYQDMAKHKRLEKLLKDVNKLIKAADTGTRNEIHGHLRDQYESSYYQTAFMLETNSKAKLGYTTLKKESIDHIVNTDFTGLTLNERLAKRRSELTHKMRESITRGLVEGKTYRGMADVIKRELEGDLRKANRIVRTETHRVRESANLESVHHAESKGIKMTKTWNTVEDERVRDRHISLNGKTIDAEDEFEIDGYKADGPNLFGVAYLDINCRCYLTYEIEKIEKPEHEELADLTYAEWQKERLS